MKRARLGALAGVLCLAVACPVHSVRGGDTPQLGRRTGEEARPVPFGPLPMRSIDSLSLLFYRPVQERAAVLEPGEWEVSTNLHYASLASSDIGRSFAILRDEEFLRWEIRVRAGISEDFELSFVVPFHYPTSGFLDEFIEDFHQATGLGPVGRPLNRFADRLFFRNQEILELPENTFAPADIPVALKFSVLQDGSDPVGLALRAGVELPTGSSSRGFGSGKLDGGLGLLLEKSLGDFSFYLSGDASFQETPRRFRRAGARIHPVAATAGLAAEWRILEELALTAQIDYGTPLVVDADVPQLSRHRLLGTLGLQWRLVERFTLSFGVSEDFFLTGPVPDVLFFFGVAFKL